MTRRQRREMFRLGEYQRHEAHFWMVMTFIALSVGEIVLRKMFGS